MDIDEFDEPDLFFQQIVDGLEKNESIEYLFFDTSIIEKYEIELICKLFPNLKLIVLAAENVLETKINLKSLNNLELISSLNCPT